jgi:MFS family permease
VTDSRPHSWWSRRRSGSFGLPLLLLTFAAVTFAFWLTRSWRSPAGLYALYVWTGLVGSLAVLQFWLLLGDMYTVTQAKRIYGLIGAGSLLGAVAGAGLARFLASNSRASVLVLAAAITMALTALGPALALRRVGGAAVPAPSAARGPLSMGQAAHMLRGQPYVRGLAGLVLISTVALTLGDYVFKSAVSKHVPAPELGEFFATVYVVLNLLALVAQLLLTDWLFRVLGLHRSLWALPILLFMGAAGVALGGGLGAALLLKLDLMRRYAVLPIKLHDNELIVAMADPANIFAIDDVRIVTGKEIRPVVAAQSELLAAIDKFSAAQTNVNDMVGDLEQAQTPTGEEEQEEVGEESVVARLMNQIITESIRSGAGDVYIEPGERDLRIRFRVDGVCQVVNALPKKLHRQMLSRLKISSGMDIAERRIPQDGRFGVVLDGKAVDFRSLNGERSRAVRESPNGSEIRVCSCPFVVPILNSYA